MGLPKTKLEYVNASGNWTQAVTPSGQDAVVMLHIAQGINTSSKCDVIMANQSPDPENANPAQAKGNLTDVFTDFQRIRLVDQETGIIIFTGRIYRIRDKYDLQYGQTVRVYGFDAYKELIEYPIEDPPSSLKSIDTTSSSLGGFDVRKRSQLIKYILSELDLNDNISVSDTDHWDDSWSTDSFQDKDLNISKIDRRVAGVIQDLAIGDPLKNVSGADIGESGYDFRVEPYFTSCAVDHKPIEMMNYFQRGTRPGRGGAYSNESSPTLCTTSTDSLTIQYPSAGDTGLLRSMLSSFEFDKPKEELYTALILHYKDESQEDQNNDQEGSSGKEGIVTFELLKGATTGTFTWANKALDASKSTPPELLNVSGGATGVARVQWHESGYLLVSNINEATFPTTGTITLVGADSGASFVMNAATQRMVTKIGVKRPIRIARNLTSNVYALRKEVVSRLIGRTDLEIVRGKFQTIRYPFVYHDLPSNASRSTNTITWSGTVDAQARGIRKAYVVAQIDSDGNYVRYAYISAVNSATSISYGTGATDTSDGTALDVTDTIRLIVPIRPGDVVKAVHTTSNINTDQVILELLYDESPGIMGANYTTVGSNGKFNNIFGDSDAVKSAIASAQSKNFPPELPLSEQAFVFDGFINRGSNPSDSNDYRKIHWSNNAGATSGTAGTLTAGDGTKYTIACASSATLTEAEYTFFFRPTSAKATTNKSNTTFQLVLATNYVKDPSDIRLGWAKAVPNKTGAKAILVLAPQLQSRDLFAAGMGGTVTEALLSKAAQTYTSDIEFTPLASSSTSFRNLTWAQATIKFGDGDTWTLTAKSGSNYSYTGNGSTYSNITQFDVNSTYYAFIDTGDAASGGNLTVRWTKNYTHISKADDGTLSSNRVLLALVAVPASDAAGYKAPRVFPMGNRSLVVNAAAIAAESITATHITATAIDTTHLRLTGTNGIGGIAANGNLNLANTSGSLSLDNTSNGTNKIAITSAQQTDFTAGGTAGPVAAAAAAAAASASTAAAAAAAHAALGLDEDGRIKKNVVVDGTTNSPTFYSWSGSQTTPGNLVLVNAQGIAGYTSVTGTYSEGSGSNDGLTLPDHPQFQIRTTDGEGAFAEGTIRLNYKGIWFKHGATTDDKAITWSLNSAEDVGFFIYKKAGTEQIWMTSGSTSSANDKAFVPLVQFGIPLFRMQGLYCTFGNFNGVVTGASGSFSGNISSGALVTAASLSASLLLGNCIQDTSASGVQGVAVSRKALYDHEQTSHGGGSSSDTTYTHTWVDSSANAILRLTAGGSGSGNDDLTIVAGSNITLTPSGDNLTIAASGGGSYTHPDPIQLGSGSASSPTYSFSTDTDTGMYGYGANSIGFSTFGVWKFVVDYAGTSYAAGNFHISGSLTKSSGTFKIPHPLDEENKTLVHGFVESPRYDLVYRGTVTLSDGTATASIDEASNNMTVGTFTALTKNPQVWVQNETGWGAVKGRVEDGNIIITAEDTTSSDTISWLVIAERNDTYINSSKEPWTDENGAFVPEWDTAAIPGPPPL
jgi:hypothetical protein